MLIPHKSGVADTESVNEVLAALKGSPEAATLQAFGDRWSVASEQDLTPENVGVSAIATWLFAEERKVGDFASLAAAGVTYIALYTGNGMTFGEVSAKMRLYEIGWNNWYNSWVEKLRFGYNYDVLDSYDVT